MEGQRAIWSTWTHIPAAPGSLRFTGSAPSGQHQSAGAGAIGASLCRLLPFATMRRSLLLLSMLVVPACAQDPALMPRAASAPSHAAPTAVPPPRPAPPAPVVSQTPEDQVAEDQTTDPTYPDKSDAEPLDDRGDDGPPGYLGHGTRLPDPLAGMSNEEIDKTLRDDPGKLGSMSVGSPDAGALFNGVQMPPGEHWVRVSPANEWGTQETVDDLIRCIEQVNKEFPGSPPMYIGDFSARHGGHLPPHVSHQSGRDVDVSYYYKPGLQRWYRYATRANLDLPRTWAFVRAVITLTDVKLLIIDRSIQKIIKDYALSIGEDRAWLDDVFRGRPGKLHPLIIDSPGHRTHIHVRFYSPKAQARAHRAYRLLVKHHLIHPPTYYVTYKVKKGDTLAAVARRFHTTVQAIRRANGLHSTLIQARKEYRIPRQGGVAASGPLVLPPRRLPPSEPVAERAGRAPGS